MNFASASATLLLLATACASQPAPLATPPVGTSVGEPAETHGEPGLAPGAPGAGPAASGTAGALPSAPVALPGGSEPTPDKALPELRVEALGMHVGGGTNSPEEKAPFHRALERQFPAFLECYRLVDDAWTGGSFGVDLKIARSGGAPTLEQPRTKIRGQAFRDCMLAALGKVHFDKPRAGPTVISYSVRFTLGRAPRD